MNSKTLFFTLSMVLSLNALEARASNSISSKSEAPEVFQPVFVDPYTGLTWGKTLAKKYSNGCTYFNRITKMQDLDYFKCHKDNELLKSSSFLDENGLKVIDKNSDAAKACQSIGARLPTEYELSRLLQNFDINSPPEKPWDTYYGSFRLEKEEIEQMQKIFGDADGESVRYWTATVRRQIGSPENSPTPINMFSNSAVTLSVSPEQGIISQSGRERRNKVRCVKKPQENNRSI